MDINPLFGLDIIPPPSPAMLTCCLLRRRNQKDGESRDWAQIQKAAKVVGSARVDITGVKHRMHLLLGLFSNFQYPASIAISRDSKLKYKQTNQTPPRPPTPSNIAICRSTGSELSIQAKDPTKINCRNFGSWTGEFSFSFS